MTFGVLGSKEKQWGHGIARMGGILLIAGFIWIQGADWAWSGHQPLGVDDSLSGSVVSSIEYIRASQQSEEGPGRVGDTVTVRGRVGAGPDVFSDSAVVFIQDRTAGIPVRLSEHASISRGDMLRIQGVVRRRGGSIYLDELRFAHGEPLSWSPEPIPVTVATGDRKAHEGQLVRVQGQTAVKGKTDKRKYLLLIDGRQQKGKRVAVSVPRVREEMSLNQFKMGDEVQITGVLGRSETLASRDVAYQVFPRKPSDLQKQSVVSGKMQTVVLLIVGGTLFAIIAVMTLRSAVRRRTQQLVESRARFRRLAEATREGIILHRDGDIVNVNRALVDMTGYDREELVGRSFREALSESVLELDREAIQANSDELYETVVVRKDGSSFPAEVDERVVSAGERRVRVMAIRDVTERKRRERELRKAKEEAEQMARLKSSLLSNMSHEFRTPITSILGYTDLILEEPEADHRDFARRIRKSGERLSRTLRTVLEMAQIEGGQMTAQKEPVEVGALVRAVADEHRLENGPSLDVTGTAGTLHTDPRLIRRIVENLVHNAIKFTPETGSVSVAIEAEETTVQIAVSDSGIGIDSAFQDDLFSLFEQESTGRTRTYEGMGLGLSLTKRMLDLLDGTIEVESAKGVGSTFTVTIPVSSSASPSSPTAETTSTP